MPNEIAIADPGANTEQMECSLRRCGFESTKRFGRMLFPRDRKSGAAMGYVLPLLGADLMLAEDADIPSGLDVVQRAMAPATTSDVASWIAELWQITAHRNVDAQEGRVMIAALAKRLRRYPGDIVHRVLQDWSGKFFPTWAELEDELEKQVVWRRMLHNTVSSAAERASSALRISSSNGD